MQSEQSFNFPDLTTMTPKIKLYAQVGNLTRDAALSGVASQLVHKHQSAGLGKNNKTKFPVYFGISNFKRTFH